MDLLRLPDIHPLARVRGSVDILVRDPRAHHHLDPGPPALCSRSSSGSCFLPWVGSLWIWHSSWPLWLKILVIVVIAMVTMGGSRGRKAADGRRPTVAGAGPRSAPGGAAGAASSALAREPLSSHREACSRNRFRSLKRRRGPACARRRAGVSAPRDGWPVRSRWWPRSTGGPGGSARARLGPAPWPRARCRR